MPTPASPATAEQLAQTLDRQRRAFLAAGAPPLAQRRDDIARLRDAVKIRAEDIAAAIAADFGQRSRHETALADIWPVMLTARHALKHLPAWMKPRRVAPGLDLLPGRARILAQPLGVVGIISPWNYPVQLALLPLIAALAAGNRVMLKPSELTPRTAALLDGMLAGLFAPEQVAVAVGGAQTGAAFAQLPFDHLFFTGSTAVGRKIMAAAAPNLTPVTLELGGKSPCIVGEDADLPAAAASIASGKLLNAGQTCISPDYALIAESQREAFIAHYIAAAQKFYPTLAGNPDYTAIVNDAHYARLTAAIDEARARGVRIVEIAASAEGLAAERKIPPLLAIDPDEDLQLMQEEIFGPVLPVKTCRDLDDAIAYVNARPRPLALYYFGQGEEGRDRVLTRTISGGVTVNDTLMHIVVDNLPFGGVGASGMGAYHGEDGFRAFSHRKGVFLQSRLSVRPLLRPPYGRVAGALLRFLLRR